jgi:CRP-like cAMP-binding protein
MAEAHEYELRLSRLLEELAERADSIAVARGAIWSALRLPDVSFVFVEKGYVVISAALENRRGDGRELKGTRRIVLATGESGTLLAPPEAGEQLEALTACRIMPISANLLEALLGMPAAAQAITDTLGEALRERQATIRNFAYVRHGERVREKLLQLGRAYGRVVPGGVRIDFPLTHQLLADMIGSARETVSLALSDLVREDFVHRHDRRYVLRIASHDLLGGRGARIGEPSSRL